VFQLIVYIYINILVQWTVLLQLLSSTYKYGLIIYKIKKKVTISTNLLQQIVCNLVAQVTNKRTSKQTQAKSLQFPQGYSAIRTPHMYLCTVYIPYVYRYFSQCTVGHELTKMFVSNKQN